MPKLLSGRTIDQHFNDAGEEKSGLATRTSALSIRGWGVKIGMRVIKHPSPPIDVIRTICRNAFHLCLTPAAPIVTPLSH